MSFEEAYNEFKIYARKQHKKQGFYTITHDFNLYILPYFKKYDLNDINRLILNNWKDYILNYNFSSSYNKKLYYSLNSFFKYCIDYMILDYNPMNDIKNFKNDIKKISHNVYTEKEFRKFYKKIDNYIIKEFFYFSYYYGTRCGETLALKFSDINGLYIEIYKNLQRRGKREIDTTKNNSSIRTIKLDLKTIFKLKRLYNYYKSKFGVGIDFYIFGGVKPLSTTTIDRIKHKTCLKYKLKEITVHEFRHSYATRMIHKGIPIDIVSRALGHSKVSTTLDIYVHNEKKTYSVFSSRLKFHTITHDFNLNLFKHL